MTMTTKRTITRTTTPTPTTTMTTTMTATVQTVVPDHKGGQTVLFLRARHTPSNRAKHYAYNNNYTFPIQ
jgi:hypothetical protein